MDGSSGPGYEYGRLEIFVRGFWSTICDNSGFTPDSALVACRALGYDGGAALKLGAVCCQRCHACTQQYWKGQRSRYLPFVHLQDGNSAVV